MRAVILAAGAGLRLNGCCEGRPKCLLSFEGTSLIERQISSLRSNGISDIVIVTGFKSDLVREVCGTAPIYVENPVFAQTNSLYSLWLAREFLKGGFVVFNSDVLFQPCLLSSLLEFEREDALLVSFSEPGSPAFGDEEMKLTVRNGKVVNISKSIPAAAADGENVGIVKFGASGASLLVDLIDDLIRKGAPNQWAPRAFLEFTKYRPLYTVPTNGEPWIEIDFPEDFARAESDVFPRIAGTDRIVPRFDDRDDLIRRRLLALDATTG